MTTNKQEIVDQATKGFLMVEEALEAAITLAADDPSLHRRLKRLHKRVLRDHGVAEGIADDVPDVTVMMGGK